MPQSHVPLLAQPQPQGHLTPFAAQLQAPLLPQPHLQGQAAAGFLPQLQTPLVPQPHLQGHSTPFWPQSQTPLFAQPQLHLQPAGSGDFFAEAPVAHTVARASTTANEAV